MQAVVILAGMSCFSLFFEVMFASSGLGFLAQKGDILQSVAPLGFILILYVVFEVFLCDRLLTLTQPTQKTFDREAYFKGDSLKSHLWSFLNCF
ncbi:hypothetical protein [uncultured Helicobacter sp.]|uniref:hypothetical protein n=2 Tax=uncultured Helicobacter sp. TaxID=175537 RepID=UPI0025D88901|nr:hypothetical protein [uncultured Helicobacter sp.]